MKSALRITPDNIGTQYEQDFTRLMVYVHRASCTFNVECSVLLQHNLELDKMAILVTTGSVDIGSFGGIGDSLGAAVDIVGKSINDKIYAMEVQNAIKRSSHEPASGG
jgi:hypothetical protein